MHTKNRDREKWSASVTDKKKIKPVISDWLDDHRWSAYVLGGIAVAGVATIALTAPGALQGVDKLLKGHKPRGCISKARQRLKQRGFIALKKHSGTYRYVLTEKGETKLTEFLLAAQTKKKKRFWDRHWRILFYDVPEKHKHYRDRVRKIIRLFGCYALQKNVWIYPHSDIKDLVMYLHLIYAKGRAKIVFVVCPRFEGDEDSAGYFGFED